MARRSNRSALYALLAAGGAWAWQNRDKIKTWAEGNPEVRNRVNQVAQGNPQVRDFLEKQVGWNTPAQGSYGTQPKYSGDNGVNRAPTNPASQSYPSTGETRRMNVPVSDTNQDTSGSGI